MVIEEGMGEVILVAAAVATVLLLARLLRHIHDYPRTGFGAGNGRRINHLLHASAPPQMESCRYNPQHRARPFATTPATPMPATTRKLIPGRARWRDAPATTPSISLAKTSPASGPGPDRGSSPSSLPGSSSTALATTSILPSPGCDGYMPPSVFDVMFDEVTPTITPPPFNFRSRQPRLWLDAGVLRVGVGERAYTLLHGIAPEFSSTHRSPFRSMGARGSGEAGELLVGGGNGLFLSFAGAPNLSEHQLSLGKLKCSRLLAAARTKRWWMGPSFGRQAADVPYETQYMLVELAKDMYAIILPLVKGSLRATLQPDPTDPDRLAMNVASGDDAIGASSMKSAIYVRVGSDPYALLRQAFEAVADDLRTFEVRTRKQVPADLRKFGWCTWDAFYQQVEPSGVRCGLRSLTSAGTPARMLILDDGWQSVDHEPFHKQTADSVSSAAGAATAPQSAANGAAYDEKTCQCYGEGAESEMERQRQANNPAASGGSTEGTPAWQSALATWYRTYVDGGDVDAAPVRIWRALAHTALRPVMSEFYVRETEFSKRLSNFKANLKFEDPSQGTSLGSFLASLREENGPTTVYAWHTLGGYWGGVSTTAPGVAGLAAQQTFPNPTESILQVEPAMGWDAPAIIGAGVPAPGNERALFDGIHSHLVKSGVDGVKVDGQSGVAVFGNGQGGGPATMRRMVRAMEASVNKHFTGNRCINCMCHSTENVYGYATTSLIRAADDFYPSESASHPVHLAQVAFNSLFLGEVGYTDWDMFQSLHPDAAMHAAARAVSGGPIYVSDRPGKHDADLLRQLVLPDGQTLVCEAPGRPTRDILFTDVNTDGQSALKIWNRNRVTGVLAAFNVQGARWDRSKRRFASMEEVPHVFATLRPTDVESLWRPAVAAETKKAAATTDQNENAFDLAPELLWSGNTTQGSGRTCAMYLYKEQRLQVVDMVGGSVGLGLNDRDWEVATVSPVLTCARTGVEWAPLGLTRMLNGGAAIKTTSLRGSLRRRHAAVAHTRLQATGEFAAYCRPRPRLVCVDGRKVEFNYDDETGMLVVGMERSANKVDVRVTFPRRRLPEQQE